MMTKAPIVVGVFRIVPKGLEKNLKQLEIRDHPDYSVVEISPNT